MDTPVALAIALIYAASLVETFVHGREIEVPAGTRAQAKLAQDIDASRIPAAAPPPSPPATDATATTESPRQTIQDTTVSPPKEQ